jgi:hypothetical protein
MFSKLVNPVKTEISFHAAETSRVAGSWLSNVTYACICLCYHGQSKLEV